MRDDNARASTDRGSIMDYRKTDLLLILLMSFIAISLLALMDSTLSNHYLIASFGATGVLIFAVPNSPFSRPKNVFLGHLISAFIGMCIVIIFEHLGCFDSLHWVACGLAASLAIVAQMLTDTIHPPGGATALAFVISGYDSIIDLFLPILFGVAVLMCFAYVCRRAEDRADRGKKEGH